MGWLGGYCRRGGRVALLAAALFACATPAAFGQSACTLTASPATVRAGEQVRLAWQSTGAAFGAWRQDHAAYALGLAPDGTGPRGWIDVAAGDESGTFSPTLQVGQAATGIAPLSTLVLANFTDAIGIDVAGHYAYLADAGAGHQFDVVDIADPARPVVVGVLSDLFRLNGAFQIRIAGHYAYVTASGSGRLEVIDISHPAAPRFVGELADPRFSGVRGLVLSGHYAYVVGDNSAAISIVDIANPAAPAIVGSLTDYGHLAGADSVFVVGRYAYVTAGLSNSLAVVDIANPHTPVLVASLADEQSLANPKELVIRDGYAYVASLASNALAIVDVSRPLQPRLVGAVADASRLTGVKNLSVSGDYAYVAAEYGQRLTIISIADPQAPAIVSSFREPASLPSPRGVFVAGSQVYVTGGNRFSLFAVQDDAAFTASCTTSVTVTGGSARPAASLGSATTDGSTVIGGVAEGVDAVTLLLWLSHDNDATVQTRLHLPVIGGHWSITLPLYDADYRVEIHTAAEKLSALSLLSAASMTVQGGQPVR